MFNPPAYIHCYHYVLESCKAVTPQALTFHFEGTDTGGLEAIIASTSTGIVTDTSWKCTTTEEDDWTRCFFNDDHWPNAREARSAGSRPSDISSLASWIWPEFSAT